MSEEAPRRRGGLLARVAFLLLLAGGLALWADLRRPRELRVDLDLTEALPGDVVEVDVTVSREGRALARIDQRFGAGGAPGTIHAVVHARPGRADVDATLIDGQGRARHTQTVVELRKDRAAAVKVR